MMRSVFAVLFAVCLFILAAQATYWGAPNVPACPRPISCNQDATAYPAGYTTDGCCSRSFNVLMGAPPQTLDASDMALTRLSVPAGTVFEVKEIQLIYTYRFTSVVGWYFHPNGLNLTLSMWNTSLANPNEPLNGNWNAPFINDQRFYFNRSSAETWGYAYGLYSNLSTPIVLSAGEYLWGTVGYRTSNPSTMGIDYNFVWYQNNYTDPYYDPEDDMVIRVGSSITRNYQVGIPLLGYGNYTSYTATYPARMCAWMVGALHNLTDGTVEDPTLANQANQAGFVVRYPVKENILNLNLTHFVESMNEALSVTSLIDPYASIQIYTAQRQWEFCYIDWYVNTKWGYSAMQQGLALTQAQITDITGLTMNGSPSSITVATRDT